VRVHAVHNRELDCHDSFTLGRGCTHSPRVVIILGSQAPVDPMEYLDTLLGCALGYHYKAFQWLNLVCSAWGCIATHKTPISCANIMSECMK
jgi:hypothetical protein